MIPSRGNLDAMARYRHWVHVLAALLVAGCMPAHTASFPTIKSPDGRLEARITSSEAGATTARAFFITIAEPNAQSSLDDAHVILDRTYSVDDFAVTWKSDSELVVKCRVRDATRKAREVTVGGRVVKLTLIEN